jgi:serine/threonine protein kinase
MIIELTIGETTVKNISKLFEQENSCKTFLYEGFFEFESVNVLTLKKKNELKYVVLKYSENMNDIQTESSMYNFLQEKSDNTGCIRLFENNLNYLVLEKMTSNLTKYISPDSDFTMIILKKLLEAVCHLHSFNVMHGDLKPENILVNNTNESFQVKLCDLECACIVSLKEKIKPKFTLQWICPEVFFAKQHAEITASLTMDMFNVGLIIASLLSKKNLQANDFSIFPQHEVEKYLSDENEFKKLIDCKSGGNFFNDLIVENLCNFDANKRCSIFELKNMFDEFRITKFHHRKEQLEKENNYLKNEIADKFAKQENLLITTLKSKHYMPHLFIVFTVKKETVREKISFGHKMLEFFLVCPLTLTVKLENAYRISVAKNWLKKIAPIIQFSLIAVKLVASMHGIPIPIPNFEIAENFIDKNYFQNEYSGITKEMLNNKIDAMSNVMDDVVIRNKIFEILKNLENKFCLTDEHYLEIRNVIFKHENANGNYTDQWEPTNTGLKKIISDKDGNTAWILNDENVIKKFHEEGKKCLKHFLF